jgi:Fe-S-cluster-containing dehydrogenase component
MEWTVTVGGQNMYGEVQRAELRIKKELDGLPGGEIGLSISEGKRIMSKVQEFVVKQELATYALARRICPSCERFRPVKDYTTRKIRTVFGTVEVKNPRWMLCQHCILACAWRSRLSTEFAQIEPLRNSWN